MKSKFEIYCALFKTTPKKMRILLRRYFYFPSDIRNSIFEEYSARKAGQFFNGRLPRPDADISVEFKLSKSEFEKLLEIHESGLSQLILDADANKDVIAKNLEIWERSTKEFALEVHNEE